MKIGTRTSALALMVVVGCALSGCCSQKDKDRVSNRIDKFLQEGRENCSRVCDQAQRDACYIDLNSKYQQLIALEIAYLQACDNGDRELIEEILRQIRDIIGGGTTTATNGTGTSQTGVHNLYDVFGPGDQVLISASAHPTGQVAAMSLAKTNERQLLSAAAAIDIADIGDPCVTRKEVAVQVLAVTAPTDQYDIAGGSVTLSSGGEQWAGDIDGSFTVAWAEPNNDGSVEGIPVSGELRLTVGKLLDVMLHLDSSQPETTITLDASGNGLLAFKSDVVPVSLPATPIADEIWLEIPISIDTKTGAIDLGTGGKFENAESFAPRAPFPVADCNDDMIVDNDDFTMFVGWLDSNNPLADANADGVVNNADFDYFYEFWDKEMNR